MAASKHVDYEYINENEIDEELRCTICKQPLQSPVSLVVCNHTFCRECIETWLNQIQTCPTCRQSTFDNSRRRFGEKLSIQPLPFAPINTRIVLNQLDRLRVRCILCQESNIQRCHFKDHEQHCTKKIVSCPSVDIKCIWTGPKDKLAMHINECIFQQIRPIIEELQADVKAAKTEQVELTNSVELLEKKVVFLLAFINKGSPLVQNCSKPMHDCKYGSDQASQSNKFFCCNICHAQIHRNQIALHACSGDCICQECLHDQYSEDYENDYDDADYNRQHESMFSPDSEDAWH
ncbi:hypothetical protein I4U23_003688 [Adineta vaga]|nr:hypothetical protein I4U23_003688 [Adineta vaga]